MTTPFKPSSLADWEKAAAKSAPGGDVDALNWHTPDGIIVKPWREAGYTTWLRATIGKPADNDRLIASLKRQVAG